MTYDMETFKLAIDVLNSIALLFAIVGGSWAWYISARRALTITRIVIHRKQESSNYNVIVKNRKTYSVTIKSISCYTKSQQHTLRWYSGENPEITQGYNLEFRVFRNQEDHEIGPKGDTKIVLPGARIESEIHKLFFFLETSHGSYEVVRNGKILPVNMGGIHEAKHARLLRSYDSWLRARLRLFCARVFRH